MFSKTIIALAIVLVTAATPCLAQRRGHGKSAAPTAQDGTVQDGTVQGGTVQGGTAQEGTAEENSACRRDTRRLCRHVKVDEGSGSFLACLQENRAKLSKACKDVLELHGM
jgi:hypothetical protein